MSDRIGIIGDIHGRRELLERLLEATDGVVEHLVFVGDYVNRGRDSAEVLECLVRLGLQRRCTFLAGNHDDSMLAALKSDRFDAFLQLGGAATVRSYVANPFGDVASQFVAAVPPAHVAFLASLERVFETTGLIVTHAPSDLIGIRRGRAIFGICGHAPQASRVPTITSDTAYIDTGCGTLPDGRLTCLLWPSRRWLQS